MINPAALQGAPDGGLRHRLLVLLCQVPSDGMRSGIQSLPGQIPAQLRDQLGGGCWDRRRLAVRPPRAGLERGIINQTKRVSCGYRNMINYQRRIPSHIVVTRPQRSAA
jgi:hypothetical protein